MAHVHRPALVRSTSQNVLQSRASTAQDTDDGGSSLDGKYDKYDARPAHAITLPAAAPAPLLHTGSVPMLSKTSNIASIP